MQTRARARARARSRSRVRLAIVGIGFIGFGGIGCALIADIAQFDNAHPAHPPTDAAGGKARLRDAVADSFISPIGEGDVDAMTEASDAIAPPDATDTPDAAADGSETADATDAWDEAAADATAPHVVPPGPTWCQRLPTVPLAPFFCRDFERQGVLDGWDRTVFANSAVALSFAQSTSFPYAMNVASQRLSDSNALGRAQLYVNLAASPRHVRLEYDISIEYRDPLGKLNLQRIVLGTYPTDWAVTLQIEAATAYIQESTADRGSARSFNNYALPMVPGDSGWTRVALDLVLDSAQASAKLTVSLNGSFAINGLVLHPNNADATAAVLVGTNYLSGPLLPSSYFLDNIVVYQE